MVLCSFQIGKNNCFAVYRKSQFATQRGKRIYYSKKQNLSRKPHRMNRQSEQGKKKKAGKNKTEIDPKYAVVYCKVTARVYRVYFISIKLLIFD